jgi:uncharacterized OB-fold protein
MTSLRDGRIEGVLTRSGRVLVPPTEYDPDSGEDVEGFVEVGPEGTIQTWCWVAEPTRNHPLDTPFAWALIALDGADTALLHAVCGPKESLATGARVRARWRAQRRGHITDIECFEVVS